MELVAVLEWANIGTLETLEGTYGGHRDTRICDNTTNPRHKNIRDQEIYGCIHDEKCQMYGYVLAKVKKIKIKGNQDSFM